MSTLDQLLRQKSKHWLKQGPEETPLSCPDCFKAFGHLGLLDGFNLDTEEFGRAVETEGTEVREHIPPMIMTCPHCGNEHDVNRLGVWVFLLMCTWEVMLDMHAIEIDGGFAAFVRGEEKLTPEMERKRKANGGKRV